LKKRVKNIEKKKKSKSTGFKRLKRVGTTQRVKSSTDTVLGAQEDASKQEGKIAAIDVDEGITLVDVETDKENMAGYKMKFFRRMTYDKVRPISEREYEKVQTLFMPDKDVQEPKTKRVADETILQESFKKLKAAEVSGSKSTQEIPSNDLKNHQSS
nr:hypothetical protein [Tanacetum cinerariifolium]